MIETSLLDRVESGIGEPTSGQLATAKAKTFIERVKLKQRATQTYFNWKKLTPENSVNLQDRRTEVTIAIQDLFSIKEDDQEGLRHFRRDYGEEAEGYLSVRSRLEDIFAEKERSTLEHVSGWGLREMFSTAFKLYKVLPGSSHQEREGLLEAVGYSPEDRLEILKRIGISIPLYGTMYFGGEYITDVIGAVGGLALPLLSNDLSDWWTLMIAVGSAFVYYGTVAMKIEQTLHLARDKRIKAVPNPTALLAYHTSEKMFSDHPKVINWVTRLGYIVNPFELWREKWWLTLFINPSIFLAGNIAAIGLNTVELAAIEATRRAQIWNYERTHNKSDMKV